jgi:phosphinothricin acetyltransferase
MDEAVTLPRWFTTPVIRTATAADAAAIAVIYNQGIRDRGATFETSERTATERADWLAQRDPRYVVLVLEIDGHVLGWASLSPYSSRACYAGVAEHSVYVAREARGHGLGAALLQGLIDAAEQRGFWKLTSGLFLFNEASRAVHTRLGFREVGVNQRHAMLDGQWLDTITVERLIPSNQSSPRPAPFPPAN